jgi:DNA-binding protein HU-beta
MTFPSRVEPVENPRFWALERRIPFDLEDRSLIPSKFGPHHRDGGAPDLHIQGEKRNMAVAKTAKVTTVTLKHLGAQLAADHEMAKKQADAILNDLVALVTKHLKKGDRIRIVGLGILQVRRRAARMGRNPATGEPIKIKASKKVAFRAAKDLKEAI